MQPTLSIVVPVFNEAQAVRGFCDVLTEKLQAQRALMNLELVFVNDGSTDGTLAVLKGLTIAGWSVTVVNLSRNFGKEAAITAGMQAAEGDAIVVIDVDLQDPPQLINEMLEMWRNGFMVVLAQRTERKNDTLLKRITASLFYKVHNAMASPPIPSNVGDFRLMDRQVVLEILRLKESNRFMKGIFAWVGFQSTTLLYEREARHSGRTKFTANKLWNLALEGITSFSTVPLKVFSLLGFLMASVGFVYSGFLIARVVISGIDLPGWSSLIVSVVTLSGIQLFGIGILGEYIGRIYIESKGRPVFIVESKFLNGVKISN